WLAQLTHVMPKIGISFVVITFGIQDFLLMGKRDSSRAQNICLFRFRQTHFLSEMRYFKSA
ncbi:MAG: hypothetical protein P8J27_09895, partial [Mariniblastus sp.]|nr:hypothetical protein [Mariniblastus sp.]